MIALRENFLFISVICIICISFAVVTSDGWISSQIASTQSSRKALDAEDMYLNDEYIRLEENDVIYSRQWWEKPVVIEEYSLIFFPVPKVACTEFKLLLRRMMGLPYDMPANGEVHLIQDPKHNNLKTLDDYPLEEAEAMMNNNTFTKAIFVREPKERLLSAFLNKFVKDKFYFRNICCKPLPQDQEQQCNEMIWKQNFTYFLERTQDCHDPHWQIQYDVVDEKWWSKIDFVGHMHHIHVDAKSLLKFLRSNKDGLTAWEKVGKEGWEKNGEFLQQNGAGHATGSEQKLAKYYTRELEVFVEEKYAIEWKHDILGFDEIHLYGDEKEQRRIEKRNLRSHHSASKINVSIDPNGEIINRE
ncbi:hypothetical protein CTEN210_06518 [Chaetoceros tenuissimus]|uniref:Sulfotransferase domain-containing protein n=1 Tax=Chaetoceros tenuissimus TaxID=426638 RepID=A0AAD3H490_9STRA|nr:hypothetical protein CTEN210_06518 [Chaetoceros tenuissimus]